MGTDIIKSFGTLQAELESAKSNLRGLDENIKRIIGRDPNEGPPRIGNKRNANGVPVDEYQSNRNRNFQTRNRREDESITEKRRAKESKSVFSRLSGPPRQQKYHGNVNSYNPEEYNTQEDYYPIDVPRPKVQSRIIRELPSREEVLAAQGDDEKSRGRSRRIFGSLLGTLQKFKQDETRLKSKDDRKAEIERKVEEQATKEREEIKRARQSLFMNRKKKQAEIRAIEVKMNRMKEYTKWEESMKPLFGFIQLHGKPSIYYKPKIMNDAAKELLKASNEKLEKLIDKKRQQVFSELEDIEQNIVGNYHDESEISKRFDSKHDEHDESLMEEEISQKDVSEEIGNEPENEKEQEKDQDQEMSPPREIETEEIQETPIKIKIEKISPIKNVLVDVSTTNIEEDQLSEKEAVVSESNNKKC